MKHEQSKQEQDKHESVNIPAVNKRSELSTVINYQVDAGLGFENVGVDDIAIPFLQILQSNSPQIKRGEQQIPGAKEGDIFNTITNELYSSDVGILVIPCAYQKAWVEWRPRELGGGFIKQHLTEDILRHTKKNEHGRDALPDGNVIVPTAYHFVLLIDSTTKDYSQAVISMTSTQLKKSRKWNSLMTTLKMTGLNGKFVPPMFSHIYRLTTVQEQNELGAWSGWHIELVEPVVDVDLYNAAKEFALAVRAGRIAITAPPATETLESDLPF